MSEIRPRRFRRVTVVSVVAVAISTIISTVAIAAHVFTDVPDSNQFHGSISWMAENEVTVGCNPPDNDQFCPDDQVTREQMASFMRRYAQTLGMAADEVTDAADTVAIDSADLIEVASIEVAPKAEANVALDAHVTMDAIASTGGAYHIVRDDCAGDVIASGAWQLNLDAAFTDLAGTYSAVGHDVVAATTTYVLCVDKSDDALPDATAGERALVASWSPTS